MNGTKPPKDKNLNLRMQLRCVPGGKTPIPFGLAKAQDDKFLLSHFLEKKHHSTKENETDQTRLQPQFKGI